MSKTVRRLLALSFALALMAGLALPACAEGSISHAVPRPVQEARAIQAAQAPEAVQEEGGSIRLADEEPGTVVPRDREIYVCAGGDDMGEGTRDDPLASLAAAAEAANAAIENTVYVILLSDLVSTRTARFIGKDVILMSEGGTWLISRGSNFLPAYDGARQTYNPALIEVGELLSEQPQRTNLSIDNVVLDDCGLHEGSEFLLQTADADGEQGNLARVQDAIVAVYGGASLTLNPGTELRNFGGMSAVRAVGGALVTAEDYSAVKDTALIDAPAGLKAILSEGAAVRIGSKALILERGAAPAPDEETPDEERPDEETPNEETPNEEIPDEEAPGEETPGEETPDEETPDEEIPDEEAPGEETPGEETPGEETPGEETPDDETPDEGSLTIIPHMENAADGQNPEKPEGDPNGEILNEETPDAESLTIIPHMENAAADLNAETAPDDTNDEGSTLEQLLQQLMALINNGTDDFTLEGLEALLADVPVEELQALLDDLNANDDSGAAALIAQLAESIGGDSGPGDELIRRLNALLSGGGSGDDSGGDNGSDNGGNNGGNNGGDNGGLDGDTLQTLIDLLGDSFTLGELSDLLSGFSPEQLGSLANLISGNGTDADIFNLFSNAGSVTGLMEMSGDPAYLVHGEEPYYLRGTLEVKLPDTLVRTLKLAASTVSSGTGQFSVIPDSRLSVVLKDGVPDTQFVSNIFQADSVTLAEDGKLVVLFSLKEGWRDYLDELNAPVSFQWKTLLEEKDFAEGEELVTRATLDDLKFVVGGRSVPESMSEVGAELRTKMLPGEGSVLTYDINGGEGGPEPNPVFVNAQTGYALESESTPTHADAGGKPVLFIGWTDEKDSTIYARGETAPDTVTSIDVGIGEDQTVHALYGYDENEDGIPDVEQQLVELSFDANGGAGAPAPILAVAVAGVGASIDIPSTEPSLKYYTFLGWSKEQDATSADYKYDAEKKADRDILITKDTTLYAVWQENPTYTLYYNANGGTGAPAAQSGVSDENNTVEMVISSVVPVRSGYSFLGWSSRRSGSAEFFAGDKVNITGGNVTLYAVWQKGSSGYSGGGGGSSGAPKTGDDAPIALYAALAVISLGAVGAGAWLILHKSNKRK